MVSISQRIAILEGKRIGPVDEDTPFDDTTNGLTGARLSDLDKDSLEDK